MLFVGGLALDGLDAALASGADAVCIDLEDALPRLDAPARARLVIRLNDLKTVAGVRDLSALLDLSASSAAAPRPPGATAGAPAPPLLAAAIVLPKVDSGGEASWAGALLDDAGSALGLVPIIETTAGLENVGAIACAHPRVEALFFGGFDLSTALGAEMAWEPLLYARSRVVHAAAAAGVPVLDSPYPNVDDEAGLAAACEQARALGMSGKTAKHARQLAAIHAAFTPSADAIAYARRVVAAFDADPTRPHVVDGKLVELPTVKRLRRLLD